MNAHNSSAVKRREWLRMSAGAVLASGFWPGCARWADNGRGGAFSFVVLNDTHFQGPRCASWFERVRTSIVAQTPKPEFCLIVGDLAEHGNKYQLGSMREFLRSLATKYHVVLGNHDYIADTERSAWDNMFPNSINYAFEHRGWHFLGLDSTQGLSYQGTNVQSVTLNWLDSNLTKLNQAAPTVLFTHFPLGSGVKYRPGNADAVLERFLNFNLVAVFNGHFHALTERHSGRALVTTNRCCSISRENHDGSREKGYFYCTAANAQVSRTFVEVSTV